MVQGIASAYGGWNWLSSMGGVGRGCGFFSLVMLGVPDVRERAPWLAERKGGGGGGGLGQTCKYSLGYPTPQMH